MKTEKRDALEVFIFDAALILTGIVTLPLTHTMASQVAHGGAWHALVQALLLFVVRSCARYVWRRYFRKTETPTHSKPQETKDPHGST
jgi:membrane protein implicated in regulation of membrane protease activity